MKKEAKSPKHTSEQRHVVIYGYTRADLQGIMRHFQAALPASIDIEYRNRGLCTHIRLVSKPGQEGIELTRFNMNRYQRALAELFPEETIALEDTTLPRILGEALLERELTVSTAESCTGGALAHSIVQIPGSSAYFMGSVVSYSNHVKSHVLGVDRELLARHGAVSRPVVEAMATGVCSLMHTDCALATSGIAGPEGGTPAKPVGTVWMAARMGTVMVSEVRHFTGTRTEVMEAASSHVQVMLLRLLRNSYQPPEYGGDE